MNAPTPISPQEATWNELQRANARVLQLEHHIAQQATRRHSPYQNNTDQTEAIYTNPLYLLYTQERRTLKETAIRCNPPGYRAVPTPHKRGDSSSPHPSPPPDTRQPPHKKQNQQKNKSTPPHRNQHTAPPTSRRRPRPSVATVPKTLYEQLLEPPPTQNTTHTHTPISPIALLAQNLQKNAQHPFHTKNQQARQDPTTWTKEHLSEDSWPAQRRIARAINYHRYVAVPSAHDAGKSFIASRLAL